MLFAPVEHRRLVQRRRSEVRRFRRLFTATDAELTVLHDDDGRCCRRESWAETLACLMPSKRAGVLLWRNEL